MNKSSIIFSVHYDLLQLIIMSLTAILVAILILLLSLAWVYLNRFTSYVKELNLPLVKAIHWKVHQVNFAEWMSDCSKNYGKLWVDNSTTRPSVYVADPDMIKEIMVKHFDCFSNRMYFGIEEQHTSLIDAR